MHRMALISSTLMQSRSQFTDWKGFIMRVLSQRRASFRTPKFSFLSYIWSVLMVRKQRTRLRELDKHMLRDIGLSRDEVLKESQRPMWDVPSNWRHCSPPVQMARKVTRSPIGSLCRRLSPHPGGGRQIDKRLRRKPASAPKGAQIDPIRPISVRF